MSPNAFDENDEIQVKKRVITPENIVKSNKTIIFVK
jgi:hypothetical protein